MEYKCNICNKFYSSYQSLWIHNKKFHSSIVIESNSIVTLKQNKSNPSIKTELSENDIYKYCCKYCSKKFKYKQGKWKHEQKCSVKNSNDSLKQELIEIKNELKQLKENSNKKSTTNIKVHGNMINSNNHDSGPKQIIYKTGASQTKFEPQGEAGTESIDQISYNEVSTIFDNEISSVVKLIELVNFNENKPGSFRTTRLLTKLKDAPENHSFCSTALESPYLSFYNTDTNSVNKERKRYFFEEVICKSIQNHEILYSKFKNKFNSVKRKQIEDNITNLKMIKANSFNSKIIGEMIRNLNLVSYNKRDLIQDTWTGFGSGKKYEHDSDEEFMAMLLDDPKTQSIIEAHKNKEAYDNSSDSEARPS